MKTREIKRKKQRSKSDKIYYMISGIILTLLLLAVAYPLIYVLSASFSSGSAVSSGKVVLWPVEFSLEGYKAVFGKSDIWSAYLNTILYTIVGTFINVAIIMIAAYPLSRSDLKGRNVIMVLFTFTMFFSGGMIPFYMLLTNMKMIDTFAVMVIPGALSVYNLIIARTFIQSNIPKELFEAASIDGCSDTQYFFGMVIPLSKAILAVLTLFSAVGHWNSYFNAMMYLNTRSRMPLQIILREILIMNQIDFSTVRNPEQLMQLASKGDVLKFALIVVSTAPILCIYPFVQKYFIKGVMIGSIKG